MNSIGPGDGARPDLLEALRSAFGEVRAEYETDDKLFGRFSVPNYFGQLLGMAPAFLVGGRGTGKTTTLRSMSYRGQTRIADSRDPELWDVTGVYWKAEPNVVSAFRAKGLSTESWSAVFGHYLNLRLVSLVLDYVDWTGETRVAHSGSISPWLLLSRSLHLDETRTLGDLRLAVQVALVDIEGRLNGSVKSLEAMPKSIVGRPLEFLFQALDDPALSQAKPFMFCIDEYENFEPYQQILVNTLIKAVGSGPYTFKIGVRSSTAIEKDTLVVGQPLQTPADFVKVGIVDNLSGTTFDAFAETVVTQRLTRMGFEHIPLRMLLPALSISDEADLLAGTSLQSDVLEAIRLTEAPDTDELIEFAQGIKPVELAMLRYWSESQNEPISTSVRFARDNPQQWVNRVNNHGFEMLFTLRKRAVGIRKYYCGWNTLCKMSDGNIRYLLRVVYDALRFHAESGKNLSVAVGPDVQTEAAKRAGATTLRELQGWSRQGGALTRLVLSLGAIFGGLAREIRATTPEVNQFRVRYSRLGLASVDLEKLLLEAAGQGVVIEFDGDKNGRNSGATLERDYQLHPIFSAYFTYSYRSKRRISITEQDLQSLATRQSSATIRKILAGRGIDNVGVPDQLRIFEDGLDGLLD
jgi:hypothetical protein